MIEDEGMLGALPVAKNPILSSDARRRLFAMPRVFEQCQENLNAIS
ncbi:hypothetical protein NP284_38920 [Rhodopseudomonas pseudopalustris]